MTKVPQCSPVFGDRQRKGCVFVLGVGRKLFPIAGGTADLVSSALHACVKCTTARIRENLLTSFLEEDKQPYISRLE